MSTYDDFIHISTTSPNAATWPGSSVARDFYDNSKGQRVFTEGAIADSIVKNHPKHHLTILGGDPGFLGFAGTADDIWVTPTADQTLIERWYLPPARRVGDVTDISILSRPLFASYNYIYEGTSFVLYLVHGQDIYTTDNAFLLTPLEDDTAASKIFARQQADQLLEAVVRWADDLHGEVLVFDQGYWSKNKDLYDNIQKANWEDVILDKERKDTIINDVIGFFKSGQRYLEFGVPWKRGVIFYGPPGNGKTISTKALMHDVSKKISPTISNLYVKSFNSWMGPEAGIRSIFQKARQQAPCLLIFEDIDSLVNPDVRSYFLNEVDGLESNDGILMIASTNHLERLDPGIAKRPSRFDRKYLFDDPNEKEREQYAEYWRHKLSKNKKIDFPQALSAKIASITKDFSFAYIKEAFVAALLVIVARGEERSKERGHAGAFGGGDDFSDNMFWQELKKQIENLRREMDEERDNAVRLVGQSEEGRRSVPSIQPRRDDMSAPANMRTRAFPNRPHPSAAPMPMTSEAIMERTRRLDEMLRRISAAGQSWDRS